MIRYIIVGLGNIGSKRISILKNKCIATVDLYNDSADYINFKDVSLDSYDAAIISTPNNVKYDIIKYMLQNRKHVLIEKPFPFISNNFNMINNLNILSNKNKCIWYTSYNHRFEKSIIKLKEILESNVLGNIYFANFLYGNGTVKNSLNSWRDDGYGVLEDLGSHLIDLTSFLFPKFNLKLELNNKKNYELNSLDFCSFIDKKLNFNYQCSFLVWKNSFKIDIYGELGSLHLDGLNKWGSSKLTFRKRIFPSGIPKETTYSFKDVDKTWMLDIKNFETRIKGLENSFINDINIQKHLNNIYNDK